MDKSEEDKKLQEYIKELVIARINALSKDLEISVGGENITREQRDIARGKIYQSE